MNCRNPELSISRRGGALPSLCVEWGLTFGPWSCYAAGMDRNELSLLLLRYGREKGVEQLVELLLDWVTAPYFMEIAAAALDDLTPRKEDFF